VDTYTTAAGLADSLADVGRALGKAQEAIERAGGRAAGEVFAPVVAGLSGGDGMVGRAGVGVAVRKASDGYVVRARGPVHIVDNPTRAHEIRPRRGGVLSFGGEVVSGVINHPGTRGKGRWRDAEPAAVDAATVAMVGVFDDEVT
jgi:hypothetical protein